MGFQVLREQGFRSGFCKNCGHRIVQLNGKWFHQTGNKECTRAKHYRPKHEYCNCQKPEPRGDK